MTTSNINGLPQIGTSLEEAGQSFLDRQAALDKEVRDARRRTELQALGFASLWQANSDAEKVRNEEQGQFSAIAAHAAKLFDSNGSVQSAPAQPTQQPAPAQPASPDDTAQMPAVTDQPPAVQASTTNQGFLGWLKRYGIAFLIALIVAVIFLVFYTTVVVPNAQGSGQWAANGWLIFLLTLAVFALVALIVMNRTRSQA